MAEPTSSPDGADAPPVENADTTTSPAATGAAARPAVARAATGPDAPAGAPGAERSADASPAADPAGSPAPERPTVAAPATAVAAGSTTGSAATSAEPATAAAEPAAASRVDEGEPAAVPARDAAAPGAAAPAAAVTDVRDEDASTTAADDDDTEVLGGRTAVLPAAAAGAAATRGDQPPPPAPVEAQPTTPMPPAAEPTPPRLGNNRLVGTAWVLLAAGIFEALYLGAYALLIIALYGTQPLSAAMSSLNQVGLTWLPVLLFALFYELTVLLLNRAGRFAYVLLSLIVAVIVYLLTTFLVLAMQPNGLANEANFTRALILPQIVLIPLVAREVMLWTGLAIGARGRRVRERNKAAQQRYERERFARSVQDADDGAGSPA